MKKLVVLTLTLLAFVIPAAASSSRDPVICGGACDGGGYVCGPNNLGSTDAYGHGYCHVVYLPSWPWVGYSYY